jgi:hypothetical protein
MKFLGTPEEVHALPGVPGAACHGFWPERAKIGMW